jgi:hypothetical protein
MRAHANFVLRYEGASVEISIGVLTAEGLISTGFAGYSDGVNYGAAAIRPRSTRPVLSPNGPCAHAVQLDRAR